MCQKRTVDLFDGFTRWWAVQGIVKFRCADLVGYILRPFRNRSVIGQRMSLQRDAPAQRQQVEFSLQHPRKITRRERRTVVIDGVVAEIESVTSRVTERAVGATEVCFLFRKQNSIARPDSVSAWQ